MNTRIINPLFSFRGLIGKIFGHKFKPRYNNTFQKESLGPDDDYNINPPKLLKQEYAGEVCVRCGCKITEDK
jgi:hypothetical protein